MEKQMELPFSYPDKVNNIRERMAKKKYYDPFHQEINGQLNFSSEYQSPKIMPNNGKLPDRMVSFSRRKETQRTDVAIHFYIHDCKFSGLMSFARKYIDELRKYQCVIGPDFSVQPQMPLKEKEYIIYMNKKITAWMQRNGITVISNVIWCENMDYEYCFDGLPRHSIIAINSTGIGRDQRSKKGWIEGYKKTVEILKPTHIIRYGAKQDGELAEISTYFPNGNKQMTNP